MVLDDRVLADRLHDDEPGDWSGHTQALDVVRRELHREQRLLTLLAKDAGLLETARMQFQSIVLAGERGHIVFMDDAEVQANVSWQNYERSWNLWKTRALATLEAERRAR